MDISEIYIEPDNLILRSWNVEGTKLHCTHCDFIMDYELVERELAAPLNMRSLSEGEAAGYIINSFPSVRQKIQQTKEFHWDDKHKTVPEDWDVGWTVCINPTEGQILRCSRGAWPYYFIVEKGTPEYVVEEALGLKKRLHRRVCDPARHTYSRDCF